MATTDIDYARNEQVALDSKNSEFWNTLCGTVLAQNLGIADRSAASLKKFDDWFFDYYTWLDKHIPYARMKDKHVLEVGLGYGSVAQRIGEHGAIYSGLDIAAGPVEMANWRMQLHGLNGRAQQGSILKAPFDDETFDFAIAIGCYHHTGDLQGAVDETWRVLKPGGTFICMVYNGLSYRQWRDDWRGTLYKAITGKNKPWGAAMRAQYDAVGDQAAPHTDFVSVHMLRRIGKRFRSFRAKLENITNEPPFQKWTQEQMTNSGLAKFIGLDIYATMVK